MSMSLETDLRLLCLLASVLGDEFRDHGGETGKNVTSQRVASRVKLVGNRILKTFALLPRNRPEDIIVIVLDSEPLPFRTQKNFPLDLNHHFIQPSGLDPAQGVHAFLFPRLLLTVANKRLVLSGTVAQDPRS